MALTSDTTYNEYSVVVQSNYPASKAFAITKSDANFLADANDMPLPARALMVNVAGDVKVTFVSQPDAAAVTLTLLAGVVYPFQVKKVWSTGTTATGIHGFR